MSSSKIYLILLICCFSNLVWSQNSFEKANYFGILPSILDEPYDTIKALDINCVPIVYERRTKSNIGIQIRPMLNYRTNSLKKGISHIGGSITLNKYLPNLIKKENSKIIPYVGVFFTYTYNNLDRIKTLIAGIEPGVYLKLSKDFSLSGAIQPGIDCFPDTYSRKFTGATNGFKPHFGLIFHIGYNF